jgi:hypothetical protein
VAPVGVEAPSEAVLRVAKALCARDYIQGPPLVAPEDVEWRWAEQNGEMVSHYLFLAAGAVEAMRG